MTSVCMEIIAKAQISSRGQIALPKAVKNILEAEEGDYIIFVKENKDIIIKVASLVIK